MQELKVIAFTHQTLELEDIGAFHIEDTELAGNLKRATETLSLSEIMFLSTCNRVEILCVAEREFDAAFVDQLLRGLYPGWNDAKVAWAVQKAVRFEGEDAARHLFRVASSMDSLVVGEREIITQVRNSFERCSKLGFTGDLLRLLVKRTIEAAKQVYTETNIARNPVSVVSLAFRKLREHYSGANPRVLVVGAGQTNRNMTRMLSKRGFSNFTVFNRSYENAQVLANELQGEAHQLSDLAAYKGNFDVLITCTGSVDPVITSELYESLLDGDNSSKVVVDLAVPNDLERGTADRFPMHYIEVQDLKAESAVNLQEREKELTTCEDIIEARVAEFGAVYHQRQVELAMREVPRQVQAIREKAVTEVFARELEGLDAESKEVLDKVLEYVGKKYNAVTMKMAKEILLGNGQ